MRNNCGRLKKKSTIISGAADTQRYFSLTEKSGKRFIRCTNYDDCGTSYPLPARGKLEATGETCPDCGAPMVVVTTARGPWKLCPNMECPGREKKEAARAARGARKAPAKKATTKKPAAKKPATKAKS